LDFTILLYKFIRKKIIFITIVNKSFRVGGKTGHFTGGSIQGLATDGKKLYVCGSFTKYGNDTIDAGNVVILNIEPQFDQETAKPWYE
jgi:hypothetical protein